MAQGLNVVIKIVEMQDQMRDQAIDIAQKAIQAKSTQKQIASHIKKSFEDLYQPHWHCIVGRYFGAQVTFEARHYIYFYVGQMGFLLFKSA